MSEKTAIPSSAQLVVIGAGHMDGIARYLQAGQADPAEERAILERMLAHEGIEGAPRIGAERDVTILLDRINNLHGFKSPPFRSLPS